MKANLRALGARGRWEYRRLRWKVRKKRRHLGRLLSSRLGFTSLALFPFVILMAASAALLRVGVRGAGDGFVGPVVTAADVALAGYRALRDEVVEDYAARYRVPPRLASVIYETAIAERIDPQLAFRLVRTESSFRPRVVGPAGAIGLAQVRPSTARWLDSTVTRERLFEAETNLRLGFRYLRMLLDMYDHDTRLALLAYNRGPGTVAALLAIGEDPGNGYAGRVLGTRKQVMQIVAPPASRAPERDPAGDGPGGDGDGKAAGSPASSAPARPEASRGSG